MKRFRYFLMAGLATLAMAACDKNGGSGNEPDPEPDPTPQTPTYPETETGFARGADCSWVTQMEASGYKFYDAAGTQTECMTLLQSIGFNAVRLRVWVDPEDGWCGKDDVVAKAQRAAELGLRVMVDFHYSDTWADPSKQYKPAAWEDLSLADLKRAIQSHTLDVLQALADLGIEPEWVQVGNEVRSGLLWDTDASRSGATWDAYGNKANEENFASFITVGYNAVKTVFPDAKVIVHIDQGENYDNYKWIFDILKSYNASYDVIGMSLYPDDADSPDTAVADCISTIGKVVSRYGKEVMICEVGTNLSPSSTAKSRLTDLVTQCKAIDSCLGVFYWEPEAYGGWQGYGKGAFDSTGRPTEALDAFARD